MATYMNLGIQESNFEINHGDPRQMSPLYISYCGDIAAGQHKPFDYSKNNREELIKLKDQSIVHSCNHELL